MSRERRTDGPRDRAVSATRALLRYPWAAALIPLGVAMGVGGLVQHAVRTVRRKRAR